MAVKVQIPTPMRPHTGNLPTVDVSAATAGEALRELCKLHPAMEQRLFDNGQLRRFVNIFINDEDIRYLENLDTKIKDSDDLAIIPAVAGG
ncbi:MAG: MoaD/ThiS family protein [Gemmataceae bacterium]|nr:MoaD/ThiS family protein [Gemmataceae bacterium]